MVRLIRRSRGDLSFESLLPFEAGLFRYRHVRKIAPAHLISIGGRTVLSLRSPDHLGRLRLCGQVEICARSRSRRWRGDDLRGEPDRLCPADLIDSQEHCVLCRPLARVGVRRRRCHRLFRHHHQVGKFPEILLGRSRVSRVGGHRRGGGPWHRWRVLSRHRGSAAGVGVGPADPGRAGAPRHGYGAPAFLAAHGGDRPDFLRLVSLALAAGVAGQDRRFRRSRSNPRPGDDRPIVGPRGGNLFSSGTAGHGPAAAVRPARPGAEDRRHRNRLLPGRPGLDGRRGGDG